MQRWRQEPLSPAIGLLPPETGHLSSTAQIAEGIPVRPVWRHGPRCEDRCLPTVQETESRTVQRSIVRLPFPTGAKLPVHHLIDHPSGIADVLQLSQSPDGSVVRIALVQNGKPMTCQHL